MSKKSLGVGVVGSGRIGTLRANLVSHHPSLEFLAVSDIDQDRAKELGEQVGAQLATGKNEEVIEHPDVTTVIVSTPEHDHADSIIHALELGKPVLVEKPISLTLEDSDGSNVVTSWRKNKSLKEGWEKFSQARAEPVTPAPRDCRFSSAPRMQRRFSTCSRTGWICPAGSWRVIDRWKLSPGETGRYIKNTAIRRTMSPGLLSLSITGL